MAIHPDRIKSFLEKKKRRQKIGKTQRRILVLLLGGLSLSLARSPKLYFRIINEMRAEWKLIGKKPLESALSKMYNAKLIKISPQNGGFTISLSDAGK